MEAGAAVLRGNLPRSCRSRVRTATREQFFQRSERAALIKRNKPSPDAPRVRLREVVVGLQQDLKKSRQILFLN